MRGHDFERDGILHLMDHLGEENLKDTPFRDILEKFPVVEENLNDRLQFIPELSTARRKVWAATTGSSHLESNEVDRPPGTEVRIDGSLMPHLEDERDDAEAWQWVKGDQ